MASRPGIRKPLGDRTLAPAATRGVKREREDDNEDPQQTPPARKRVTISRKPCIVCTEDVSRNRFPQLPHSQDGNKNHNSDVCFECFREHLRVEVETKTHEDVGCPQCSKPLEESDIRKLASEETYQECVTLDLWDPRHRLTGRSGTSTKRLRNACNKKKSTMLARTPNALGVGHGEIQSIAINVLTRKHRSLFRQRRRQHFLLHNV